MPEKRREILRCAQDDRRGARNDAQAYLFSSLLGEMKEKKRVNLLDLGRIQRIE
jgi:hypothetical protein